MDPFYGSGILAELLDSTVGGASIIFALMISLLQCFFGFKLFRHLVTLIGFVFFAVLGYNIGVPIAGARSAAAFALAVMAGIAGGLIAFKFFKAGVFIQCYIAGSIVGFVISFSLGWTNLQIAALSIVFGIAVGIAGVKLIKPVIMASSAIAGGIQSGVTLAMLVKISSFYGVILGAILACCGLIYQISPALPVIKIHRRGKDTEEDKDDKKDDTDEKQPPKVKDDKAVVKGTDAKDIKVEKKPEKTDVTPADDETPVVPYAPEKGGTTDIESTLKGESEDGKAKEPAIETATAAPEIPIEHTPAKPADVSIMESIKSMFQIK